MKRVWKVVKVALVTLLALLLAAVGFASLWVYRQLQPQDTTAARAKWPKAMSFDAADRAALELVAKMTLDEKVDQMTGSGIGPLIVSPIFRGGEIAPVYAGRNERLGVPPVAFSDGPRGVICGRSTAFPVAMARAATWDVELQRRVGDVIGKETRAQGANYWGGLCINLVRHPSMGRAEETFGEDSWLTGELAVATFTAVQRHNVMACAKHFALNSMETARFKNSVEIDERTLHASFGVAKGCEQPVVDRKEVEAGEAVEDAGVGAVAAPDGELLQQAWQADVARLVAETAGTLDEGAGEVGLADTGLAGDHQVVAILDEAAVGEAEYLLAVEMARVLEVDVLDRGRVAQLRRAEPLGELALLAREPLGVDEKAEPLVEGQLGVLGRAELLPHRVGHARELHCVHLVQGLLDQHSSSFAAAA